jgi:hypothetical protein
MFSPVVDENRIVMTGSILPYDYTENLEALLRKNKSRTASSSATPPAVEPVTPHHLLLHSWPSYFELRTPDWPQQDGVGKPM